MNNFGRVNFKIFLRVLRDVSVIFLKVSRVDCPLGLIWMALPIIIGHVLKGGGRIFMWPSTQHVQIKSSLSFTFNT